MYSLKPLWLCGAKNENAKGRKRIEFCPSIVWHMFPSIKHVETCWSCRAILKAIAIYITLQRKMINIGQTKYDNVALLCARTPTFPDPEVDGDADAS